MAVIDFQMDKIRLLADLADLVYLSDDRIPTTSCPATHKDCSRGKSPQRLVLVQSASESHVPLHHKTNIMNFNNSPSK